jgi:hypothetical protein
MKKPKSGKSADLIPKLSHLNNTGRLYIALGLFIVYLVFIFFYGREINIGIVTLSFLPVLIWAYFCGRLGGAVSGLVIIPFFMHFYKLVGFEQSYTELSQLPFIIYLIYAFWGFVLGGNYQSKKV